MSTGEKYVTTHWSEFITPEILAKIQEDFGQDMSVETLRGFSYEHLPPEIKILVDEAMAVKKNDAKASIFEQEKLCTICNEKLIVDEVRGQKFFTCKNIGNFEHRTGISKKELDEAKSYFDSLPEERKYKGYFQRAAQYIENGRHEIIEFYKTQKRFGLKAWVSLVPYAVSGSGISGTAYRLDFMTEVVNLQNIEYDISEKGKGKVVEYLYCQHGLAEWQKSEELKYHSVLAIQKIHHLSWCSCHELYVIENTKGMESQEYRKIKQEHVTYRVIAQRLDAELDKGIMEYMVGKYNDGDHKYVEVSKIPLFYMEGVEYSGGYKWMIARMAKLAKDGKLKIISRSPRGEYTSDYIKKINRYRYVPEDAVFMTEDQLYGMNDTKYDVVERRKLIQQIETEHPEIAGLRWKYQPKDGEIFFKGAEKRESWKSQ